MPDDILVLRNLDKKTRAKLVQYAKDNDIDVAEALKRLLNFAFDMLK